MKISDFEQLFRSNYVKLCNSANRILKNEEAAKDVVQDVFVKLWQRREQLTITSSVEAYVYRATLNAALNHLEKQKRTAALAEHSVPESHTSGEELPAVKELQQRVERAIDRLPPKCKTIFVLSRFEEKTYNQIAAELGISVKTVENQMGKALRLMRQYLSKETAR